MKVKLTVKNYAKFVVACEATDIKINDSKDYADTTVVIVQLRHASQLYECGLIQSKLNSSINIIKEETLFAQAEKTEVVHQKK